MATAQEFDQAERSYEAAWLAREEDGGDDSEPLTRDEAIDLAADDVERTPEAITFWLNKVIDAHKWPAHADPVCIPSAAIKLADGEPCSAAELLALLFNSSDPAAIALRDMARGDKMWRESIQDRAGELLWNAA